PSRCNCSRRRRKLRVWFRANRVAMSAWAVRSPTTSGSSVGSGRAGTSKVNAPARVALPPGVVTATSTAPAAWAGVTAVIWVALRSRCRGRGGAGGGRGAVEHDGGAGIAGGRREGERAGGVGQVERIAGGGGSERGIERAAAHREAGQGRIA